MDRESTADKIRFNEFGASGDTSCSKPLSKYSQYGLLPCAYCSFFWQLGAASKNAALSLFSGTKKPAIAKRCWFSKWCRLSASHYVIKLLKDKDIFGNVIHNAPNNTPIWRKYP